MIKIQKQKQKQQMVSLNRILQNKTNTLMFKDISNEIKLYFWESVWFKRFRNLEIGGFKWGGKIGQFKDDGNYVSGNDCDNFQDKILKNILGNESKY